MQKLIFLLLLTGSALFTKAQVLHIPASQTFSTSDIAENIKQKFTSDRDKVHAIYTWVASNIRYDTDSANVINMGLDPDAKVTAALRRRRGVCENYAAIFNEVCIKSGLTSFVIDGYTKQNGFVDRTAHSWAAVFIDNSWWLCDPTWDEGRGTTKYFLVHPSEMISTHMPFDPMWQLLDHPVSHSQFYSGNVYTNKSSRYFNYVDTIAAYSKMDSLQRFRASAYRIEQHGLPNTLVKSRLDFAKMHVEIIRQDKDVDLYNSAVADLNEATATYNSFVQYRNNRFLPAVSDKAMEALLDGIDKRLASANKNLDEIARTEAVFKFSTEAIRNKLNSLATRAKVQKDFLDQYLNTAVANRESLFYSKQVSGK